MGAWVVTGANRGIGLALCEQLRGRGESVVAVINAAAAGIGLAVVPCFLASSVPNLQQVAPHVLISREIWLVYPRDVARLARVVAVIDFIAEIVVADREFLVGVAAGTGTARRARLETVTTLPPRLSS